MHVSVCNACLPEFSLERFARWAASQEIRGLQLQVPPVAITHRHGTFLSSTRTNKRLAKRVAVILERYDVRIDALASYDNLLFSNYSERLRRTSHLTRVIKLAARLGAPMVVCNVGRDPKLSLDENVDNCAKVLRPILKVALDSGVRLAALCDPMIGADADRLHGNIAFAPALWSKILDRISEKNFGLAFDPSHLYWQQVDIDQAIRNFKDRIFLVHARDLEIDAKKLAIYGNTLLNGWWCHRVPGLGVLDWQSILNALRSVEYNGPLVLLNGDSVWTGSESRIKQGLVLGRSHIRNFLN